MKATGIIERTDSLGRIMIPKEIRRQHRIHQGDPLEIYSGEEGILLKRHSEFVVDKNTIVSCVRSLEKHLKYSVLICDCHTVIAASRRFACKENKSISDELTCCIRAGKEYLNIENTECFSPLANSTAYTVLAVIPLRLSPRTLGCIAAINDLNLVCAYDTLMTSLRVAGDMLLASVDTD